MFLKSLIGGAYDDFELRVVLADEARTLLTSLVDLVRILMPHIADPHQWCATFLGRTRNRVNQDSVSTRTLELPGALPDFALSLIHI